MALAAATMVLGSAAPAAAQTDYYNTDRNRPVRIEDAYATELYALEVKIAPLRVERAKGGVYSWGFDPEIGYGILPRTSVELGLPFSFIDGVAGRKSGVAGLEVSLFHNLNIETRTLPAFGLRADVTFPVGGLADDAIRPSVAAIGTRTFPWARIHVNAEYAFGDEPDSDEATPHGTTRWLAGVAIDRAFPLNAMLLIADLYVQQPLRSGDDPEWNAGAGIRYQVSPYLAVDAGVGRRLTADPAWYFTFGTAYHLGVRSLMPRF